ncbi:MAG TPA: DUF2116 family Zn-ribbon domain-containing protein [Methanomassiliicoccales archaeon]|nr:DUF2116 family Zn-ribbon domain-containing protein [Methanomassiliicoccales archaeon]
MPERLPPHSHCVQCDNPIAEGETYCSEECRNAKRAADEKVSRRNWVFIVVVIVVLIALSVASLFIGK